MTVRWLTLDEAREHVRAKTADRIRAAVKQGDLPCYRQGREMRFKTEDLDTWQESQPWEPAVSRAAS